MVADAMHIEDRPVGPEAVDHAGELADHGERALQFKTLPSARRRFLASGSRGEMWTSPSFSKTSTSLPGPIPIKSRGGFGKVTRPRVVTRVCIFFFVSPGFR